MDWYPGRSGAGWSRLHQESDCIKKVWRQRYKSGARPRPLPASGNIPFETCGQGTCGQGPMKPESTHGKQCPAWAGLSGPAPRHPGPPGAPRLRPLDVRAVTRTKPGETETRGEHDQQKRAAGTVQAQREAYQGVDRRPRRGNRASRAAGEAAWEEGRWYARIC